MSLFARKPRIVHVHGWHKNGVGVVTVWVRYKRQLLASTTWQTFDSTGRYLPHSMESVEVERLGEWRPGSMVDRWPEDAS